MAIQSADFAVSVSATDFISWKGEGDADYIGNPFFVQVLSLLAIPADPAALYRKYFDSPVIGSGDVLYYRSSLNGDSIFAVDMYRDAHDQLDIVTLESVLRKMRREYELHSVPSSIQRSIRFITRREES